MNSWTYRVLLVTCLLTAKGAVGCTKVATCDVQRDPALSGENDDVSGTVTFTQENSDPVSIEVTLTGFDTSDSDTMHGFHIHMDADIGQGCSGAGGHYNPESVNHGLPDDSTRHVGDLGNVEEDGEGKVSKSFTDSVISLHGDQSIIGRSVVVHAMEDIGSAGDSSGSAGTRLSCCVITKVDSSGNAVTLNIALMMVSMATALLLSLLSR